MAICLFYQAGAISDCFLLGDGWLFGALPGKIAKGIYYGTLLEAGLHHHLNLMKLLKRSLFIGKYYVF